MRKKLEKDNYSEIENKLIILYFINKNSLPVSHFELSSFILGDKYMTFFTLQFMLSELIKDNFIEKIEEHHGKIRYVTKKEGKKILNIFSNHMPKELYNKIDSYLNANYKKIRKDYETISSYNFDENINEYIVSCSLYDENTVLMDLKLSVVSKTQAQLICNNFREDTTAIYANVLNQLLKKA